jgi:hypothetical protein
MKAIVTGATVRPYEFKDEKTGEVKSGVTGILYYIKGKPSGDKSTKGFEACAKKCSEDIARAAYAALNQHKGWIVADIDLDEAGGEKNKRVVITDFEVVGPINQFTITPDGVKARTAAA